MRIATALARDALEVPSSDAVAVPSVVVTGTAAGLAQDVVVGRHRLTVDEPAAAGGADRGPGAV